MHLIATAILLAVLLAPAPTQAGDVRIISPNIIYGTALTELGAEYARKTGNNAIIVRSARNQILDDIATAMPPADVIGLPMDMMNTLYLAGGIVPGTYTPLGRGKLGLAVRKGAAKPDISTVAKLATTLQSAKAVLVTDPKGGAVQAIMIESILKRPEFQGVNVRRSSNGDGTAALARGEGDIAIQLVQDILKEPDIELVAPLPAELGGFMDTALAVSARSPDPKSAMELISFLTGVETRAAWTAKGIVPFPRSGSGSQ